MWKMIRIIILLLILVKAIQQSYAESIDLGWQEKFYVAVYLVNAETKNIAAKKEVNAHMQSLSNKDFEGITHYFSSQAAQYGLGLKRPIEIILRGTVDVVPPAPPESGNTAQVMLWSIAFRFYSWAFSPSTDFEPDAKLYLVYHNPKSHPALGISTALHKGRMGRINVYGEDYYHQKNLVVIAHELLHTLKATDKYDLDNNLPIFPDGFAEPKKLPLYPQRYTELMGGRLPVDQFLALMPDNLTETVIGVKTAKEIGWVL